MTAPNIPELVERLRANTAKVYHSKALRNEAASALEWAQAEIARLTKRVEELQLALDGLRPGGPREPDNSMVICPNCTHQFPAISVNDQKERDALRAKLEAAEKDAVRYRYVRQIDRSYEWTSLLMRPIRGSLDIDAAIDAAMEKSAPTDIMPKSGTDVPKVGSGRLP